MSLTSPIASAIHSVSEDTPALAAADNLVNLPYELGDQASDNLGDDEASGMETYREMPSIMQIRKQIESLGGEGQDHQCSAISALQILQTGDENNPEKKYRYFPLQKSGNIRLVRLVPGDQNARVECKLIEYPLQQKGEGACLYEALSYFWGNSGTHHSILIGEYYLRVTANLYTALLHLRDELIDRILWVDAICINQEDLEERAQQVQFMAEIYCKANRVIVWLGEAAADSHQALKDIRFAADDESERSLRREPNQPAILALLQRDWFQRIWILQEVAAARHVLIMCCSTTIDGYAFCLGLQSLQLSYDDRPELRNLIRAVIYLIRGSIFRPKYTTSPSGAVSLGIRPLGELIDMYHAQKATDPRDRVFALLGMSSDDPHAARLLPNYKISFEELLHQLVEFVLGSQISAGTWTHAETAFIKSNGYILGKVVSTEDANHDNRQKVVIVSKDRFGHMEPIREWTLQNSAESVQTGDFVCFLEGASKPMIIRPCNDHFSIVMVTATPPEEEIVGVGVLEQSITSSRHEFLLVWHWDRLQAMLQDQEYETLVNSQVSGNPSREVGIHLDKMGRLWNVALILEDAEEYEGAIARLQESGEVYRSESGTDALRALRHMEKCALLCKKIKQWVKAEKLFKQVARLSQQVQGSKHPDTTNSMANLVSIYRANRLPGKAKSWEKLIDIIKERGDDVQIMESEMIQAAETSNVQLVDTLLDWSEIQITEPVLMATLKGESRLLLAQLLLDRKGNKIEITEGIMIAIAESHTTDTLELWKLFLNRGGDEIKITEGIFLAAERRFDLVSVLLDRKGDEIPITERIIQAVVQSVNINFEFVEFLLDRAGDELQITDDLILAAARNPWRALDIIRILFDRKGDVFQVTENLIKTVVAITKDKKTWQRHRQKNLDEAMVWILREWKGDTDDTGLVAMAKHAWRGKK